jgi:hypothetical protein
MLVNLSDGRCRSCAGSIDIIDADDRTMSVRCNECGMDYAVGTEAFGPLDRYYYPALLGMLPPEGQALCAVLLVRASLGPRSE